MTTSGATTTRQRGALEAFDRAIGREAHNLRERPDLLWQQLYNRLQWDVAAGSTLLYEELQRRTASGAAPWLRTRMRPRESEAVMRTLVGHRDAVGCCAFTPDGRRVVTGGDDGTVRVWDPASGQQIAVFSGHDGRVNDCVVLADGALAVTAGWDGTLRAWAIGTQASLGILLAAEGPLMACAAGPWGGIVVAGGVEGILHAVTVPGVDQAPAVIPPDSRAERGSGISAAAVSPDGSAAVSGHSDGSVSLWDLRASTPHRIGSLESHADIVFTACFTPDGATLITGDGVGVLRLWDWAAQRLVGEVEAHRGAVNGCVAVPSGDRFVSVGDDAKVRLGSVRIDEPAMILEGHHRPATCCAVSPTGGLIATGSDDGTVRIWELSVEAAGHGTGIAGHDRWAVACSFSADGTRLVTGSRDGDMIAWDAETMEVLRPLGPQAGLEWCELSPDGARVVAGGDGATLWDVASGRRQAVLAWSPPVRWCGFSPDGEVVAGLDAQGKRMWDLTEPDPPFVARIAGQAPAGDRQRRVPGPDLQFVPARGAFGSFGSEIATPGPDGMVLLWEIDADRPRLLGRHDGQVASCAWDPGGKVVASAGEDQVVRLWDVRQRTPLGALEGHADWINHLVFLDRGLLASASSDGTVRLWDTEAGTQLSCYPAPGNVFLSCAAHAGRGWLCATDIAGDVIWLALEWVPRTERST